MRTRLIASALVAGALATSSNAQQSNLLRQQEKLQQVAIQKVEASIKEAVSEAQKLQASGSTARAVQRLKEAQRQLDDPILPPNTVTALKSQLNDAIRNVESGKKPEVAGTAPVNPLKEAEVARLKASLEEEKEVRRGVETIGALIKSGSIDQAKKELTALSEKYPTNPTVIALPDLVNRLKNLDDIKAIHATQIENLRRESNNLQRASILPKWEYELPKDWKEITERRKTKLSPELQTVMNGLRREINLDAKNIPLSDILKSISEQMKLPLIFDKDTMKDAGIDQSSLTTVQPGTPVTGRTALRMALAAHGLTYIIKANTIHIVTREAASRTMETRAYYIGDLVSGTGPLQGGAVRWGPQVDEQQTRENANQIIKLIKDSVDPQSWRGGGSDGKGEIVFHWPSMSIVVKASAEVHGLMANTLSK